MFPGQGTQTVGMARSVLESSPAARAVLQRADAALNEDLSTLIFVGPEDQLRRTANAQPAILTVSIALLEAMRERTALLSAPAFVLGHSLGEYTALVATGALTFEDAVRLVRLRGVAMQDAVPGDVGGMAAVIGVEADALHALCAEASCEELVAPANYNAPGQIVVAGHRSAIDRLALRVSAVGGRAVMLQVSAPFHCKLMAPATEVVRGALERLAMRAPGVPLVSNFDARPTSDPVEISRRLAAQLEAPVRWQESVQALVRLGVDRFIEIGPGGVLARLVHRIAPAALILGVDDAASLDAFARFVQDG